MMMCFICSCRNKKEEPSSIYTLRHKQVLDAKKLHNACGVETEQVVSLFITLIRDGSLHNVGMAPDEKSLPRPANTWKCRGY